jgi:putative transposase
LAGGRKKALFQRGLPRELGTAFSPEGAIFRYKVLRGALRERVRAIIRQVCEELGVTIVSGVLSSDHVHMFVSIPPKLSVSEVVRRVKGRSSRKI